MRNSELTEPQIIFFMAVLGILAYFLRVENGMFFLAIVGAWILRQGGQNKTVIWLFSALVLGIVVVKIGGVGNILNTLEDTQSVYGARTLSAYSSESSLGIKMMQLPFPINYLGMTILSQVIPFPFWSAFNYDSNTMQDGIFYFPYALAGLFWFNVWIRFILNRRLFFKFIRKNKYLFAISLLYIVLVASTEINARRLMAIYPVLFLGYVFVTSHEKAIPKKRQIFYNFGIYAVLLLIYFALKF